MKLYEQVRSLIIKERLINNGDNVIVALSGGPDSVFLFYILLNLQKDIDFNMHAAHVNHMYRGDLADRDEKFVKKLCDSNNIDIHIKRKNADEYARELGMTSEEAGRKLRYDFFNLIARNLSNAKIAVAHNRDDQVETVLQRLIRGTGIDGLAAMSYVSGNVIRPILDIEKKDILIYLEEKNIDYCFDHTNELPIYGRNKIRLNLLPELEEKYNPNIRKVLFRLSKNMSDDKKIIEKHIDMLYEDILLEKTKVKISLDIDKMLTYDDNEIFRIFRKAIAELKGSGVNVERKHLENALNLLKSKSTGKGIDLADDIKISLSYNCVNIIKGIEKIADFLYNVSIFDEINVKDLNKHLRFDVVEKISDKRNINEFYFDLDKIKGKLVIRNRRNGDSIIPIGMKHKKKLKDVFIDMKIPRYERDKKMILADEEKIIWVEDFRISELCKITTDTKKVLKLTILED